MYIFYISFYSLAFLFETLTLRLLCNSLFSMTIQNEKIQQVIYTPKGGGKFRDKTGSQRKRQRKHQRGREHIYNLLFLPSFIVSSYFILLFIASWTKEETVKLYICSLPLWCFLWCFLWLPRFGVYITCCIFHSVSSLKRGCCKAVETSKFQQKRLVNKKEI